MEAKISRYGRLNTWDALKLLALLYMFIDHLGYFILADTLWLRAIGRGAIPIFLFLTGYAPAARFRKDLLFLAAAMDVVNVLAGGLVLPVGILGTILIGRAMCRALDNGKLKLDKPYEWLAVMVVFFIPTCFICMDGTLAMMFVMLGYMQRHAEAYPARERLYCFIFVFAFQALWDKISFEFGVSEMLIVFAVMAFTGWLLWRMRVRDMALPATLQWSEPGLRLLSRYTLWIYALHFGAGQLLTGKHY